jgi:predicted ribosome quality control (RQC) complex YloA/Tae2 family protein
MASTPSGFVTKLRKYLKSRRVTSVTQVGTDRIIEIQFSDGRYRLFLEFYAAGNIVLTDNDLNVLVLFRMVTAGAAQEELRVGLKYSLDDRQQFDVFTELNEERLRDSLRTVADKVDADVNTPGEKQKNKKDYTLRKALVTSWKEFSPVLIDHALQVFNLNPSTKVNDILTDDALFSRLMLGLAEAQKVTDNIMGSSTPKGYIIAKPRKPIAPSASDRIIGAGISPNCEKNESWLYEEYQPFIAQQYVNNPEVRVIEIEGFNKTVDEFYSSIEAQLVQSRHFERDENAKRKLKAARQDHEKRLDGLQLTQEINYRKAQAIEANLQSVQDAIAAVNGLVAQGMGWLEIERLIEMEQAKHNSVAEVVKLPLKLYENTATLLLKRPSFDDDEDFAGNESDSTVSDGEVDWVDRAATETARNAAKSYETRLAVDVDLGLSPWANARLYYDQKKTAAIKEQKTLQSSIKALKNTEKKINADLTKALKQEKEVLRPLRKPFWFEKFMFFISSDGYLVLGGRDIMQNEILYKRYLKKGDIYVHADLDGAASVIVKNRPGQKQSPIPPLTLTEAGTLVVVTSSAWDSKAITSAWWVPAEQVSKTSAAGDYLPAGQFAILGQKRFLPPAHLLLGFGVMFYISDESKARHLKHRIPDVITSTPNDVVVNDNAGATNVVGVEETDGEDEIASQRTCPTTHSVLSSDQEASLLDMGNPLKEVFREVEAQSSHSMDSIPAEADAMLLQDLSSHVPTKVLVSELETGTLASELQGTTLERHDLDFHLERPLESTKSDLPSPITNRSSEGADPRLDEPSYEGETDRLPSLRRLEPEKPQGLHDPFLLAGRRNSGMNAVSVKQKQPVRGKRGKSKKLRGRYEDQDEEDRRAALCLLGSVVGQGKVEKDALARAAREQVLEEQKQRRQQQLILVTRKGKETEQLRQKQFQEELDPSDGEDPDGAVDLEAFVGTLLPGDEILDAIVVCGPWTAVGTKCRWKAKLQPGATKKGKIVREILTRWSSEIAEQDKRAGRLDMSGEGEVKSTEQSTKLGERALVKSFKEQEIVGVIPVTKCKVMMGAAKTGDGKGKGKVQGGTSNRRL